VFAKAFLVEIGVQMLEQVQRDLPYPEACLLVLFIEEITCYRQR
jgi:hypothetical protein